MVNSGTVNSFVVNGQAIVFTISGQAVLDGSPVQGAKVYSINTGSDNFDGYTTTDSNGEYSFEYSNSLNRHILIQYDDGTDLYNAKSLPYVTPQEKQ